MPKKPIKIELIHDVVCSWCPIGYRNVKAALGEYENQLDVEFKFLPYELNPEMPEEGESIEDHLKRRNKWNTEQLRRYREDLIKTASKAGLTYDFSKRTHYWNTAKPHTLMHLAEKIGRQDALNEILIQQYFAEGLNVGDTESLANLASSIGIDGKDFVAALSSPKVAAEMAEKKARVQRFNVRSVPTFVVNDSEGLRGSNSVEFFVQYLSNYLTRSAA
jgi:predicted DsbA family dithiol-disulfide isomerase